ncbi:MAG: DUF2851 family protein, partial [Moraxellaceae bacterium]
DLLILNSIIPLLMAYGNHTGQLNYCERAIDMLESLAPEDNMVVRTYQEAGIKPLNALETQGLFELMQTYCDKKKCLQCLIGTHLLK